MPEMKPTVYVSDKDLPAIKDWKIGETYEMLVQVKMTSVSQHERGRTNAVLQIQDMMVPEEKDIKDMDDSEFAEHMSEMKRKDY